MEQKVKKEGQEKRNSFGIYQQPPVKKMHFNPSSEKHVSVKKRTPRKAFNKFRDIIWEEVSANTVRVIDCISEINRRWSTLSDEEQEKFDDNGESLKIYCTCRKPYDENDGMMVACELCNDWFHPCCIDIDLGLANAADFFTARNAFV